MPSVPRLTLADWRALAAVVADAYAELDAAYLWRRDALCREYPAGWFFASGRSARTADAAAVCRRCAVRRECLAFAMGDDDARSFGVWAGTLPQERRGRGAAAA